MLITKITDNFYQLTDVFSAELLTVLVGVFDQVDDTWNRIPDAGTNVLRLQHSLNINYSPGTDIYRELAPALSIAEVQTGKLYQNGPQLWYDGTGYINTIHDGDVSPNHCVNVQVYLNDGDASMGTWCFDQDAWHQAVYRKNCGYMLIGPTRIPHGMKSPVVDSRLSLYQGFRNTEIPSDIW